ncbi:DUF86 domain-containing protein [bacterium]|nr:DUF86 domain-containing protein [bacterium]
MKKRPEIFFDHMLIAINTIEKYIHDYNYKKFMEDSKTTDAVIRQLEILGEAASNIPLKIVIDSPISWHSIVGMRNRLIHDYFGVDLEIVWKTSKKSLGSLKKYLQTKLSTKF